MTEASFRAPNAPAIDGRRPRGRRLRRAALIGLGVAVAFLALGNLAIVAASQLEARTADPVSVSVDGVPNLRVVDERLWRGAAPGGDRAYARLASRGVTTVVDLRAEEDVDVDGPRLERLGLDLVRIPLRDGQAPAQADVDHFLQAVSLSEGTTFVHCGAGVGRVGTMAAAYEVAAGGAGPLQALRQNLAVGPPSLEQLAFVARLGGGVDRPNPAVVAMSRALDAPRRLWSRYGL